jgi:hypothetical protein
VTRSLGLLSAPAALLALCVLLAAAFVWGLWGAMAQAKDGPVTVTFAQQAALFAFPVLTPLLLIAVHRVHWRLMRHWLKRAAKIVLGVWAVAALLMAYALL